MTSARAAVVTSAQLGSYDTIKNNLLVKHIGMREGVALHFFSAMLAGIITVTAANPGDRSIVFLLISTSIRSNNFIYNCCCHHLTIACNVQLT